MIKIRRNDKCPCGSGKKYKKCCYLDPDKNAEILRSASIAKNHEEISKLIAMPANIYQLNVELVRMGFHEIEEEVSRVFELEGKQTLYDFHNEIQTAFGWDYDHMFSFYLGEELFDRDNEYSANPMGEHIDSGFGKPTKSAIETQLRDLDLSVGFSFWYLFDYGDELVHKVTLKEIREMESNETGFPKLIKRKGIAPSQYGEVESE